MDEYEEMRRRIIEELEGGSPKESEYKYKWVCGICGNISFSKNPIKECVYKCGQQ